MPQYTFFCSHCNVRFKRRLEMGDHPSHKCVSCRKEASRVLEGFAHEFVATTATALANSGVTKHDYPTADNVVGRSAEAKWEQIHRRNDGKQKFRRDTGAVALIRRDLVEGGQQVTEYTAMGQSRFEARKQKETRFKEKANRDGISQPSKRMP